MSLWFLTLREKFPNTELLLIRKQENTDQKLLRIWTLYAQCYFFEDCTVTIKNSRSHYIALLSKSLKSLEKVLKMFDIIGANIWLKLPGTILKKQSKISCLMISNAIMSQIIKFMNSSKIQKLKYLVNKTFFPQIKKFIYYKLSAITWQEYFSSGSN